MKPAKKILGLAIGQKSIQVAEVTMKGERPVVGNFGEFAFPEGVHLSAPGKLGEALAQFLKDKRFTTKDAIIGLPAKRLVTRKKELPAAPPVLAASTLRLQAEGEFSAELDNLVMDFAGTPNPAAATSVLLVATNKVAVDECLEMSRVAGLKVQAVTSTGAAVARVSSRLPGAGSLVLMLGPAGAELVQLQGHDAVQLKHINVVGEGEEAEGILAGEIRRTTASFSLNGSPASMILWKGERSDSARQVLEQRLGMPVTAAELRSLVATDSPGADAYLPAVAVALVAMDPAGLPLDFMDSRLAPPKPPAVSLQKKVGLAAAIALAVLIGAGVYTLTSKASAVADQEARNQSLTVKVKDAQALVKRYSDAVAWIPKGPHFVNLVRDLTYIFPQQPNTIWLTNLSSNPEGWEMTGQAVNTNLVHNLVDALLNDPRFQQPNNTQQVTDQNGLITFKIRFNYLGEAPPQGTAAQNAAAAARTPTPNAARTQTPAAGRTPTAARTSSPASAPAAARTPATAPAATQNQR